MKKLLLAAALCLSVLLILVVRALGLESRQLEGVAPVAIAVDSAGAVDRLAGAIRIPTVSFEDTERVDSAAFRALHDYLAASFPRTHAALERETVAGLSLLFTWTGSEPDLEPMVLMGHLDVVPVIPGTEAQWTHPAFGGVVDGGYVWGRGTMDDKVSVMAILEAVEALVAEGFQPRRTVYLAFGHDEEVGGNEGAAAVARTLEARGAEPYAMVVDEGGAVTRGQVPGIGGAVALVGVAEKGYVNTELVVDGAGGHSSTPPEHTNIGILAAAIQRLEASPFPARLDGPGMAMFDYLAPEMPLALRVPLANRWLFGPLLERVLLGDPGSAAMIRTTTAVTIVEGGVKANVLPARARAVVNHRIRPGETTTTVLERVRDVVDDPRVQVRILGSDARDPSSVSDADGPAFAMLARTVREVLATDGVVVAPYLVVGGTDAKHFSGRSPAVFRFLPVPFEADGLSRMHGIDERVPLGGYVDAVRFFRRLLENADRL
ncbi:MAG: M20 family peptidase [Longimicrobiales bacterium]